MKIKKVDWIDGLKGICCLLIVVHHYILIRYPSAYFGSNAISYLNNYDTAFAQNPLSVFVNGNFLVCLFFILSSVVICLQSYNSCENSKQMTKNILKRYLRFAIPIFICSILLEIFMRIFENNPHSILDLLKSSFITVLWKGDNTFNGGFWVLHTTFIGTFIAMPFGILLKNCNKKIIIVMLFITYIYFFLGTYYLTFALGIIIAYWLVHFSNKKSIIIGLLLIFIGLIIGGYPTEFKPTNFYEVLNITHISKHIPLHVFWHIIGAFMVCFGITMIPIIQKTLSNKVFKFLGTISFYVYVLHEVARKLVYFLLPKISLFCNSYMLISIIGLIIMLLISIALAIIFTKYVQKYIDILITKILKIFEKDEMEMKEG